MKLAKSVRLSKGISQRMGENKCQQKSNQIRVLLNHVAAAQCCSLLIHE